MLLEQYYSYGVIVWEFNLYVDMPREVSRNFGVDHYGCLCCINKLLLLASDGLEFLMSYQCILFFRMAWECVLDCITFKDESPWFWEAWNFWSLILREPWSLSPHHSTHRWYYCDGIFFHEVLCCPANNSVFSSMLILSPWMDLWNHVLI